jgi:hypothetical protein
MTQNPSQKLHIVKGTESKEFLRGYLESYCDVISNLVEKGVLEENDPTVKAIRRLEDYLYLTK